MPPFYRIAEVAAYSLLNFLPYIALAIYPFRKQLRFSQKATVILIAAMSFIQMLLGTLAAFSSVGSGILSAISTLIYAGFYFLAIKAHPGKIVFILLILSNIANFIVSCSKCIEGFLFAENAMQDYRWSFSLIMLFVEAVYLTPLFFYIKKFFAPTIGKPSTRFMYRYLWLIPATFYFIWYYHFYMGSHGSSLELALKPEHSIFLLIINLGALLIYFVTVKLMLEMDKNEELAEKNHILDMQQLQHENLLERINEARRAKHDVRHHITVISGYLQDGEYDKLNEYIKAYKKSLPDDSSIVFCRHYAINSMLLFFAQQSKNNGVDYDVSVNFPEKIGIEDYVISIGLGNLLENAVEAASAVKDTLPKIVIRGKAENNVVFLRIENTFEGGLSQTSDNIFASTKSEKRGIGISSVQNIVEQNGGMMEIETKENRFCVSVMLCEKQI